MTGSHPALTGVCRLAREREPAWVDGEVLHLEALDLFVRASDFELDAVPAGRRCMVSYECSVGARSPGIRIFSVGVGATDGDAVLEAASQWCLGVLPVLAAWRGAAPSCFVDADEAVLDCPDPVPHRALLGPVLRREEGGPAGAARVDARAYLHLLRPHLETLTFWGPLHWLECFSLRQNDGTALATCRLDNVDWSDGEGALRGSVASWPGQAESFATRRQFILLVPTGGEPGTSWGGSRDGSDSRGSG